MADDGNNIPADPDANTEVSDKPSSAALPKKIGHYSIKSIIASGGMGTVYLAQQENPRRSVALKVMKKGIASKSALRRFEYESQILARLKHTNIAQVYEAGTHDDGEGGVPYFAMEYIANSKTIIEYTKSKKMSTRERLAMFVKVCDAVYHGHQKGIIHRDLKPGNILVDSGGEPKIIDFGVARATDSDLAITTLQTDIGQLIGTLQYMSPEQCDGDPHDLDTRSDVYALGVVLYELLTEKLPYDVSQIAVFEAARMIREEQPTNLSTINKTLRGDVETIALKALEKDRDRRYATSAELSQDIQRYLHDEPIAARPPSVSYQIRMYAKRKKVAFAVLSTLALALPILSVATVVAFQSAAEAVRARNAEQMLRKPLERALEEIDLHQQELSEMTRLLSDTAAGVELHGEEFNKAQRIVNRFADRLRRREYSVREVRELLQSNIQMAWSGRTLVDRSQGGSFTLNLWSKGQFDYAGLRTKIRPTFMIDDFEETYKGAVLGGGLLSKGSIGGLSITVTGEELGIGIVHVLKTELHVLILEQNPPLDSPEQSIPTFEEDVQKSLYDFRLAVPEVVYTVLDELPEEYPFFVHESKLEERFQVGLEIVEFMFDQESGSWQIGIFFPAVGIPYATSIEVRDAGARLLGKAQFGIERGPRGFQSSGSGGSGALFFDGSAWQSLKTSNFVRKLPDDVDSLFPVRIEIRSSRQRALRMNSDVFLAVSADLTVESFMERTSDDMLRPRENESDGAGED